MDLLIGISVVSVVMILLGILLMLWTWQGYK